MTTPFSPVGERARWRIAYEVLEHVEVDETVTYTDLATALDVPPTALPVIQSAARRAGHELLVAHRRAIEAVPKVGYRVVRPIEHMKLARGHQRRASTALTRGHDQLVHVDRSGLDPGMRATFDVMATAIGAIGAMARKTYERQNDLEAIVRKVSTKVDRNEEEHEALTARVRELEQRLGITSTT